MIINYTCKAQQNLVPNGSFEDTLMCPTSLNETIKCKNWFDLNNCSSDYFNSCTTSSLINVPSNYFGFQQAKSGKAYCGFYTYFNNSVSTSPYREGIYTRLMNKLEINQTYHIEFFLSLADSMKYGIKNIDVAFTDTINPSFVVCSGNPSTLIPISLSHQNYYLEKNTWIKIEGDFVANGNEKYMVISNFNNDNFTDYIVINHVVTSNTDYLGAYYYIDDIKLELKDTENISEEIIFTPNNDGFNDYFEINTKNYKEFRLMIYNRWGNTIYSSSSYSKWDGKYKSNNCPSGTYYFLFEGKNIDDKQKIHKGYIQLIN
ncbi:MAG: gliding motility-associated C-terminal domain-containing protein [Bacteroidetes bacterium]|nr:gliding motility-associated C-terminal domain-containing protein [Bacteroidota bacterium]